MLPVKIDIELCKRLFDYRDGKLFRKNGERADYRDKKGARAVTVKGQWVYAHRVIWAMHNNEQPGPCVDHKDGNRENNRIENLRSTDKSGNAANHHKDKAGNNSKYRGVYPDKTTNPTAWWVGVKKNGVETTIARYEDERHAARAYDIIAECVHGEFFRPNLPGETFIPVTKKRKLRPLMDVHSGKKSHYYSFGGKGEHCYRSGFETAIEAAIARDIKVLELGLNRRLNFACSALYA